MDDDGEDFLQHYGTPRRSGRYPWGSGIDPQQHSRAFKSHIDELRSKGLSDPQIAQSLGIKTPKLRAAISISSQQIKAENQSTATRLSKKGMGATAIGKQMGVNESVVRGWLKAPEEMKNSVMRNTANAIREQAKDRPFLDVGKGNEHYLGVTETTLRNAVALLEEEGFATHSLRTPQLGVPGKFTTIKVLTKAETTWHEVRDAVMNKGLLSNLAARSHDGGLSFHLSSIEPVSLASKRVAVRFKEDGGALKDGVIELRRGVADLDLKGSRYAQVRVAVDGTHFMKGMAMYADKELPAGIDVIYNSAKSKVEGKLGVMKPLKLREEDKGNRFGASTYPETYTDKNGKEHTSALNIVGTLGNGNVEGRWAEWSNTISSQMLSKQSVGLASTQLGKARVSREQDLAEILRLTNPVVKQKMLNEFADAADSAASHLKAAAFNRQGNHVILPMNTVRPHEIYAPQYENGTKVVLVRFPHAGPFEIPDLVVNNKNITARRIIGSNAKDAVGIHHSVAEKLSGADFDGDTVLVIPNEAGKIKSRPTLEGLKNFDPKTEYAGYPGMSHVMAKSNVQREMGTISNLITDMNIRRANDDEMARAVRHSMVVIDAEKHGLNYKLSEQQNGIASLKKKYQSDPSNGTRAGASTIISRAGRDVRVPHQVLRKQSDGGPVDPKTGELVWVRTGETRTRPVMKTNPRTGEKVMTTVVEPKLSKVSEMSLHKDAHALSSGEPIESVYATHANSMKSLANEARKVSAYLTHNLPTRSPAAAAHYAKEVASLNAKLKVAQRNAPLERQAQTVAYAVAKARIDSNPHYDKDDIKKVRYQSLTDARLQTGAAKVRIGSEHSPITESEWHAIQAGALAPTRLKEILANADMTRVKELATPRTTYSVTPGQLARARSMEGSGRSLSEIAAELGIPRTTLSDNLKR